MHDHKKFGRRSFERKGAKPERPEPFDAKKCGLRPCIPARLMPCLKLLKPKPFKRARRMFRIPLFKLIPRPGHPRHHLPRRPFAPVLPLPPAPRMRHHKPPFRAHRRRPMPPFGAMRRRPGIPLPF